MARRQITVALVEDSLLVSQGIATLLKQSPGLRFVGSVPTGDVKRLLDARPQVVLVYDRLRSKTGMRVVERVRPELPGARVIVMDVRPTQEVREFIRLGVVGFVMKDATPQALVDTIEAVAAGLDVLPPELTPSLFSRVREDDDDAERFEEARLTPREREVIELIGEGLGNERIAARLDISAHTVKSHVRNIMKKLDLHTRLQLAAFVHHGP